MNSKSQNFFTLFLKYLKVKHTQKFSAQCYAEHPHKENLYGLSKMLSSYMIENAAFRVKEEDKSTMLTQLEPPYVAFVGDNFSLVSRVTQDNVCYHWVGREITVSKAKFMDLWNGIILLAEPDEDSIEPDYKAHKRQDVIHNANILLLVMAVAALLGGAIYSFQLYKHSGLSTAFLLNLAGICVSYWLVLKQMHIHSSYADRICSLFLQHGDCNNVLDSDASKLFGVYSWSEIGLGYFVSNSLLILFLPALYPYVALLNLCTLPYTLWSVWYQQKIARQWCTLCLLVQATLWLLFFNNLLFGLITFPIIQWENLLLVAGIYMIPTLALHLLIPTISDNGKREEITQEINSIKSEDEVFRTLLQMNTKFEIDKSTSSILWGNPDAKNLITVITNPHCYPCGIMHGRLEQLLENTGQGFCIQYILTSFSEELEKSSQLLIAMHQQMDKDNYLSFLDKWYTYGKVHKEEYYLSYPFDTTNEQIIAEHAKHRDWVKKSKITTTPTILFNGYKLPAYYKVKDLSYFSKIDIS